MGEYDAAGALCQLLDIPAFATFKKAVTGKQTCAISPFIFFAFVFITRAGFRWHLIHGTQVHQVEARDCGGTRCRGSAIVRFIIHVGVGVEYTEFS